MTTASSNLARQIAGSLRREWPGRRLECTTAGPGRVSVTMPRRTADELYLVGLCGAPADLGRAGERLTRLTGLPVRVLDVAQQRPHVTRTDSYVATLTIGDDPRAGDVR
jgi:hypothetical protein